MEKQPHQEYRDELADKLKEIRNSDPENPEVAKAKAQEYLDEEQSTSEYKDSKDKHLWSKYVETIYDKDNKAAYPIDYEDESLRDEKDPVLEVDSTVNSSESAENAFFKNKIFVTSEAREALRNTEFNNEVKQFKLAKRRLRELGLLEHSTLDEIYKKAQESGLKLCPAEIGPRLSLKYPRFGLLEIAMEPIDDGKGNKGRYFFYGDASRVMLGFRPESVNKFPSDDRLFVFLSE